MHHDQICLGCNELINSEELMAMVDIARFTGLSYGTIRNYRSEGRLPEAKFVVANVPVWGLTDIHHWWHEKRVEA